MASRLERPKAKQSRRGSYEKNKDAREKYRIPRSDRRCSEASRQERIKSETKHGRYHSSTKRRSTHSRSRTREISPHRERYEDDKTRRHHQDSGRLLKYYRNKVNDERSPSGRGTRKSLETEITKMLRTEQHHTRRIEHRSSGKIREVVWCPRYIRLDIKQHARGGTSLLHHRCRSCRQICFNLLGRPGTRRLCLQCSGWNRKDIPDWYYHKQCKYC